MTFPHGNRHGFAVSILSLCLLLSSTVAFSQGEIPVDMYTGTPSISVPIGVVSSVDVNQPVTLSYNANMANKDSWFGSGWSLHGSASVSRDVRGLPDDFSESTGLNRKGWLELNASVRVAYDVGTFTPKSDTLSTTYTTTTAPITDESYDYSKLNGFNGIIDTEPDVFNFTAGSVSGMFVFDNSSTPTIRTIPYVDVDIQYTRGGTANQITSFTIKTPDGYTYLYTLLCGASRTIVKDAAWTDVYILPIEYKMYSNIVNYTAEWMLTKVTSPNGAYIDYTYETGAIDDSPESHGSIMMYYEDPVYYQAGFNSANRGRAIFSETKSRSRFNLSSIAGSTGSRIEFSYVELPEFNEEIQYGLIGHGSTQKELNKITFRDSRKGSTTTTNLVKIFELEYLSVFYKRGGVWLHRYQFLKSIKESSGCDRTPPYIFWYRGIEESRIIYEEVQDNPLATDEWGFFNGMDNDFATPLLFIYPSEKAKDRYRTHKLSTHAGSGYYLDGGDKSSLNMSRGTLDAIDYPSGGKVRFNFEPNAYLDDRSGTDIDAGGYRVAQVMYYDGTGARPVLKKFVYTDSLGRSSGRIFRKPSYVIPAFRWQNPANPSSTAAVDVKSYSSFTTTELQWRHLSLRSETDMNPNDAANIVGYTRVKVIRDGAGYAVYEFEVPGVYGQTVSDEWQTPITLIARQSSSISTTSSIFPTGGTWRFPYAPNPFYDYERGVEWRKREYTDAGKLVRQVKTTYQRIFKSGSSAAKVYGIKYEKFALGEIASPVSPTYLFSKYFLLTGVVKVPATQTETLYDASDVSGTKFTAEVTEYVYATDNNRPLSQIKRTASDGTIYRTKFKYPKEYPYQAGTADTSVLMVYNLASASSFRHGSPIETVTTRQAGSGAPEQVIGASFVKYRSFNLSKPLVESYWTLQTKTPISDFVNSSITTQSGVLKFNLDGRYVQQSAVLKYQSNGLPRSTANLITRDSSETAYGFNGSVPVVSASQAVAAQSGFSDFENTTAFSFLYSSVYLSGGRSGANAYYPKNALYKDIKRTSANNYVLSFWAKNSSPVTISVVLKNTGGTVLQTNTISLGVNADFTYVQRLISVASLAASVKDFRVELSVAGLSSPGASGFYANLSPLIDDVFFYPEHARMESYTYQMPFGVASVTNGDGSASHRVYDNLGREKYVMDRDKNIVKHTTYRLDTDPHPLANATFSPSSRVINSSITLSAGEFPCFAGTVSYEWNFGSGWFTGSRNQPYMFTSLEPDTILLRVSTPGYSARGVTKVFQPINPPVSASMCAKGVMRFNSSTATTIASHSCTEITETPPAQKTIFKVYGVANCTDACVYRWFRRDIGTTAWLEITGAGTQYTCEKIVTTTKSFEVKCELNTGDGYIITLGPFSVEIL